MNLLKETLEDMKLFEKTSDDIVFIGSRASGHSCTWDQFCALADREYDESFGAPEVATDLEIHFKDGSFFYRYEYDGSEEWRCWPKFSAPKKTFSIKSLFVLEKQVGWCSLAEIHGDE